MYYFRTAIWIALLLAGMYAQAQTKPSKDGANTVQAHVDNGDTIPFVLLNPVDIAAERQWRSKKYQRRYGRLKRYVLKTYPYAKIAGEKIKLYEEEIAGINNETRKKLAMKKAENALKAEFEGEIRDMTINEGRVLIKLIDRETGKTSYNLIKEFRGSFSAFMWQAVSRIFGNNLKDEYNSKGDDRIIEEIVQKIENGQLAVPVPKKKEPKRKRRSNKPKQA